MTKNEHPMTSDQCVLLIEQHQPTRALYKRVLQQEYKVFACADTQAAAEVLQQQHVVGIVLEPSLVNGHAWAFVEAVRASRETCNLPIVVCSELDERRHGQDLGVTIYLLKPVLPTVLLKTMRQMVAPTEVVRCQR